jgi:two-component system response regulator NreC
MPGIRILILTMHTHEEYIFQILKTGATGYLLKDAASSELITAVEAVNKGDAYLSPSISRSLLVDYVRKAEAMNQKGRWEPLTEREREVLQLIAEGFTNRSIAEKLHVSVKTVDNHRTNLMVKLGIHDTAGLVKYAIARGLVSIDEYRTKVE